MTLFEEPAQMIFGLLQVYLLVRGVTYLIGSGLAEISHPFGGGDGGRRGTGWGAAAAGAGAAGLGAAAGLFGNAADRFRTSRKRRKQFGERKAQYDTALNRLNLVLNSKTQDNVVKIDELKRQLEVIRAIETQIRLEHVPEQRAREIAKRNELFKRIIDGLKGCIDDVKQEIQTSSANIQTVTLEIRQNEEASKLDIQLKNFSEALADASREGVDQAQLQGHQDSYRKQLDEITRLKLELQAEDNDLNGEVATAARGLKEASEEHKLLQAEYSELEVIREKLAHYLSQPTEAGFAELQQLVESALQCAMKARQAQYLCTTYNQRRQQIDQRIKQVNDIITQQIGIVQNKTNAKSVTP